MLLAFYPSPQVYVNGELEGTYSSEAGDLFTSFGVMAEGVEEVVIEHVAGEDGEWLSLLEVCLLLPRLKVVCIVVAG